MAIHQRQRIDPSTAEAQRPGQSAALVAVAATAAAAVFAATWTARTGGHPALSPTPIGAALVIVTTVATTSVVPSERLGLRAAGLVGAPLAAMAFVAPAALWAVVMGTLIADVIGRGTWQRHSTPIPTEASTAATILLGVSAYLAWRGQTPLVAATPAITASVILIISSRFPAALGQAIDAISHAVGTVFRAAGFGALSVFAIVVPFAVRRSAGINEFGNAGWAGSPTLPNPMQPSTVPKLARPQRLARFRVATATVVLVALVSASVAIVQSLDNEPGPPNAAFADAPWWPELEAETEWAMFNPGDSFNPLRFPPNRDFDGKYLNIVDNYRVSWRPPECACDRVSVWMYGGSTTFGMGQRDDRTIASEIARRAWADGIAIDMSNRGVLGDLLWEEAERFAWEVQVEDPPSIVIFYDGYNEVQAVLQRATTGTLDRYPIDWGAETALGTRSNLAKLWRKLSTPDRARTIDKTADLGTPPDGARPSRSDIQNRIADQYETARRITEETAERHRTTAAWFWQPSAVSSPSAALAHPQPNDGNDIAGLYGRVADGLDPSVVDISDAFEAAPSPVIYDDVHTNELGAKIVAEEIYKRLKPELEAAAGER